MTELQTRWALRELVDMFSLLADRKDAWAQTLLFTENARLITHAGGVVVADLTGRSAIGNAFERFLKGFDVVYHFNGQHVVRERADVAMATLYCLTYLFNTENGVRTKTSIGVRYEDEYERVAGSWLINKRTSYFEWQTKERVES
jgi:hypothetical protein